MSGGSFGYLAFKDVEDYLYSKVDSDDLDAMLEELEKYPYASTVAEEYKDFLTEVEAVKAKINELHHRLTKISPVLQAVEWYTSCDWGEDSIVKACEEYRA